MEGWVVLSTSGWRLLLDSGPGGLEHVTWHLQHTTAMTTSGTRNSPWSLRSRDQDFPWLSRSRAYFTLSGVIKDKHKQHCSVDVRPSVCLSLCPSVCLSVSLVPDLWCCLCNMRRRQIRPKVDFDAGLEWTLCIVVVRCCWNGFSVSWIMFSSHLIRMCFLLLFVEQSHLLSVCKIMLIICKLLLTICAAVDVYL